MNTSKTAKLLKVEMQLQVKKLHTLILCTEKARQWEKMTSLRTY